MTSPADTKITGASTYVTDGGLETDLIFHHGVDLPDFAAFPLIEDADGRALLTGYYDGYADIARSHGVGLMLEAPTWRANPDWAARLGYDATALDRANRSAVELMHQLRESHADLHDTGVLVTGVIGPRGDGYVPDAVTDADELAVYHSAQLTSFKAAGADLATVLTMTGVDEALGLVAAARSVGLPIAISFTVETDGRLPDGSRLRGAVEKVDAAGGPEYFLVNCAHPTHMAPALTDGGAWLSRIHGLRPNASTMSHAELDAAEELDEGDPAELRSTSDALRTSLPNLRILGGCCGTDVRHVAALWEN